MCTPTLSGHRAFIAARAPPGPQCTSQAHAGSVLPLIVSKQPRIEKRAARAARGARFCALAAVGDRVTDGSHLGHNLRVLRPASVRKTQRPAAVAIFGWGGRRRKRESKGRDAKKVQQACFPAGTRGRAAAPPVCSRSGARSRSICPCAAPSSDPRQCSLFSKPSGEDLLNLATRQPMQSEREEIESESERARQRKPADVQFH